MPLNPAVLTQALITMDDPSPGQDTLSCANAWFEALWQYYSGCTALNPLALVATKELARGVFVPILAPAMVPSPLPLPFCLALGGAVSAMVSATLIPGVMLPVWSLGTPNPIPLGPLLLPAAALGMAGGSAKPPSRIYIAGVISGWMYGNLVLPTIQPAPPVPIF